MLRACDRLAGASLAPPSPRGPAQAAAGAVGALPQTPWPTLQWRACCRSRKRSADTPLAELTQVLPSPVVRTPGVSGPAVSGRKIGSRPEAGVTHSKTSLGGPFAFGDQEPPHGLLAELWMVTCGG